MQPMSFSRTIAPLLAFLMLLPASVTDTRAAKKDKKKSAQEAEDPYAEYVWPPPPDEARIRLTDIVSGRSDVEDDSKLRRALLGSGPQGVYDWLKKPFGTAWDPQGRLLVSDTALHALLRFDRAGRRMDVLGTKGALTLDTPLGLEVATDGTIYVADVGIKRVLAFDPEGKLEAVYGREQELQNPTDVTLSPEGNRLYVADSKAHRIHVFDRETAELLVSFGRSGTAEGEFNYPTSLDFDAEGMLYVVDQLNSRVQILTSEGEFVDQFGNLGLEFGNFVRPKDVFIDPHGFILVSDGGLNNVQLFDLSLRLLTFIGRAGPRPGQFGIPSGIAVRGDEFAVVDQLNHRVQVFRFVTPRDSE